MIDPNILNQLTQKIAEELKKPHNQYHIVKALEGLLKKIKNK